MWFAGLAITFSLGIYQAYVPLTIALFVLQLLSQTLEGKADWKEVVKNGLLDCLSLIIGVVLYLGILKLMMAVQKLDFMDSQGVATMGQLSVSFPELLLRSWKRFFSVLTRDYCGLSPRKIYRLVYLLLGVLTAALGVRSLLGGKRKAGNTVVAILLCLIFLFATNFIEIMCSDSWIYTLMIYGYVAVCFLPLVFLEHLPQGGKQRILGYAAKMMLAVLLFLYIHADNLNYNALFYANRQTENYFASIITQARMTEGFTPEKT